MLLGSIGCEHTHPDPPEPQTISLVQAERPALSLLSTSEGAELAAVQNGRVSR